MKTFCQVPERQTGAGWGVDPKRLRLHDPMSHSEKRGQSSETRDLCLNTAEMGFVTLARGSAAELAQTVGYEASEALDQEQQSLSTEQKSPKTRSHAHCL